MINTRALSIASMILFTFQAPALEAQERKFSLAVDPDGAIVQAAVREGVVLLDRWSDGRWTQFAAIDAGGNVRGVAVAAAPKGVVLAWLETDAAGAAHIAVALSPWDGGEARFRLAIEFGGDALALAALNDETVGLLATAEGKVRWTRIDVGRGIISAQNEVILNGVAGSPAILPGSPTLIAWEERTASGLRLAAARVESGALVSLGSFRVRGFGGVASPELLQTGGGAALVWQGAADSRSAIFARDVAAEGFGPVRRLPAPAGVRSVLRPRRALGAPTVFSGYAWNAVRWSGVRYDLSGGLRKPQIELRAHEAENIREPDVVIAGSEATWLWRAEDGAAHLSKASALTSSVFERSFPSPAEGEKLVLAFGDSITAGKLWMPEAGDYEDPSPGYELPLERLLTPLFGDVLVINAGSSGETTVEGLVRLESILTSINLHFDYILLLEGTNDFFAGSGDTAGGITTPNLVAMVELIRQNDAIPIVGTMLPRDRHPTVPEADRRALEVTEAMIPAMRLLGVRLARFHELFPLSDEYLADIDGRRLHPTELGYGEMARIWLEALLTLFGDVDRDGEVTFADARRLSASLNTFRGALLFNADGDMNNDGIIDFYDLSFIVQRFGENFAKIIGLKGDSRR